MSHKPPYVEFMLRVILETLETEQVTDQVKRLVRVMASNRLSTAELM